jgi:SAM-dependent methyltransferase
MTSSAQTQSSDDRMTFTPKDKSCLLSVIQRCLDECAVDRSDRVLVLGGGAEDLEILTECGFNQILLSNLNDGGISLDAEDIALPDDSYPIIFAHAVLHHCRSPHKALGEMARVAQKHVFFLEPNDSWFLRLLVRMKISFPYEIAAVVDNGYVRGGMRYGPIPNYIYRLTGREVEKAVAAYVPERQFRVRPYPYWDFYLNEHDLVSRKESRQADLARLLGPSNFLGLLRFSQVLLNLIPGVRSQGNKFFCAISKGDLQSWIEKSAGEYRLKKQP